MNILPTLSSDNWVLPGEKMLDYLLTYYITTDARQSYLFNNNLISLPYSYAMYSTDPIGFRNRIMDDLNTILKRYFEVVDVKADVYEDKSEALSYYVILSASVMTKEGLKYDLNKVTTTKNNVTDKILSFSNYGLAKNYVFSQS